MRPLGRAGFTLIEIMATLAILGTAFFLLLNAHYNVLRLYDDSQESATMLYLLELAVARAETDVHSGNLSVAEEFGDRFPDYRYKYDAVPTDEENNLGLYEVLVTVEGPVTSEEIVFYVYSVLAESE